MRLDIVNDLKSDYRKQRFHNAVEVASISELLNALDDETLAPVARIIIKATAKRHNPLVPTAWAVYDKDGVIPHWIDGDCFYVTVVLPLYKEGYRAVPLYSEEDLKRVGVL